MRTRRFLLTVSAVLAVAFGSTASAQSPSKARSWRWQWLSKSLIGDRLRPARARSWCTAGEPAGAGVGFVRVIDRDFVEPSNLQRQVLFDEADVAGNLPKAEAAAAKLRLVNSTVTI